MPGNIELAPLSERFDDAEIAEIAAAVKERGVPALHKEDENDAKPLVDRLDEDILRSFMDQLEGHEIACEIYLPVEFEGTFEVAEDAEELEEMERPEEEVDPEEMEEEDELDMMRTWSRYLWKVFFSGAKDAIERQLPLHVYR
jgi:hypothetical protein